MWWYYKKPPPKGGVPAGESSCRCRHHASYGVGAYDPGEIKRRRVASAAMARGCARGPRRAGFWGVGRAVVQRSRRLPPVDRPHQAESSRSFGIR